MNIVRNKEKTKMETSNEERETSNEEIRKKTKNQPRKLRRSMASYIALKQTNKQNK